MEYPPDAAQEHMTKATHAPSMPATHAATGAISATRVTTATTDHPDMEFDDADAHFSSRDFLYPLLDFGVAGLAMSGMGNLQAFTRTAADMGLVLVAGISQRDWR
jgi:hypothetical protein